MDPRDKRPPRSARPPSTQQQQRQDEQLPSFPDQSQPYPFASRPSLAPLPFDGSRDRGGNVSFQHTPPARPERQRTMPSPYQNNHLAGPGYDAEANDFDAARVGRKKSLVRPDREKIEPGHRQWHYRSAIAQAEEEGAGRMGVIPSSAFNSSQFALISLICYCSNGKLPTNINAPTGTLASGAGRGYARIGTFAIQTGDPSSQAAAIRSAGPGAP